jgi:hypothetical protein
MAALGAIIAPALTVFWLWTGGMLTEARIAVVDFNRWYVGAGFSVPEYSRVFADRVFLRVKTEPVWTAGVVGSFAALWSTFAPGDSRAQPHLACAGALAPSWSSS